MKKTYIPSTPRSRKLKSVGGGTINVSGGSAQSVPVIEGHTHDNKIILDAITQLHLRILSSLNVDEDGALIVELSNIIKELDTTVPTDENLFSALRTVLEIRARSISKTDPDTAQEIIKFVKGIEIGTFTTGPLGAGAAIKMENGVSRMEVDNLDVRMRATFRELIIESLKHIGGQLILSPARMKCTSVVDGGTYYRCYFDTGDGKVSNEFVAGDQARCQVFTGSGVKMYWRLVTSVGADWINLSKTDAISGSSIPEAGDDIVQLGNRTDTTRQNAQILSTVGSDAPSWKQYKGINAFSLEGKDTTVFSGTGNKIDGKTVFVSSGSNLDDWATGTSQDIEDAQAAANAAALAAQQAIDDAAANVGLINTEVGKLQAQIDGEVSNWFYPYSPTLANYPASDWTTNTIKDRHVGDTFTNTAQAPATDAGKSWRFVKNDTVYSWTQIADSDAVLALQKAAQAQSTADGKSTTYLIQPTSYKLGDIWVLAADQTVNGVAYKSGEILTATQDSTTYNQAHWVKKVRYTDDTAVNNIRGGVNLLLQSDSYDKTSIASNDNSQYPISKTNMDEGSRKFVRIKRTNTTLNPTIISLYNTIPLTALSQSVVGKEITISFDARVNLATTSTLFAVEYSPAKILSDHGKTINLTTEWTRYYTTFVVSSDLTVGFAFCPYDIQIAGDINDFYLDISRFAIKFGNIKDEWDIATEDVEASIDAAKQEALTAAGNAQTSANNANTAIGDLNTYVDGSFKDGVIEASEAKAIEKYINIVNTEKSNLEATYNTLYTNTYLEGTPKTNLLNAKVTYFGAVDTLLGSINTAISDGKTTTAEKNAVDSNYTSYKSALASLQTAIENANKSIQAKLDTLSTEKVNNIQVGGRNYVLNSATAVNVTAGATIFHASIFYVNNLKGKLVSFSATILNKVGFTKMSIGIYNVTKSQWAVVNTDCDVISDYVKREGMLVPNDADSYAIYLYTGIAGQTANCSYVRIYTQIEEGNKATAWREAPEDVQAAIDAVNATAADAQAKANTSKAVTDKFATTIDGGLISTVITEYRELNSEQVTGLISGIQGENKNLPFLVAGGTYAEGIAGTAKAIIRHDGTSKFTDTEITGKIISTSGEIGGFTIQANGLVNKASNTRILFDGVDGGQSFIRINESVSSPLISIRTDVASRSGISISTYASNAMGLEIVANVGSKYAIKSSGGHQFYQRGGEIWTAPGIIMAAVINSSSVSYQWAVSGVDKQVAFNNLNPGFSAVFTHNLGHTDYVLGISLGGSNAYSRIIYQGSSYFTVAIYGLGLNDSVFVQMFGRNKYYG